MNIVEATLIKHRTDDGLAGIKSNVPLGKTYKVDLDSIRTGQFINFDKFEMHEKQIIDDISGLYLFLDLLEIKNEGI